MQLDQAVRRRSPHIGGTRMAANEGKKPANATGGTIGGASGDVSLRLTYAEIAQRLSISSDAARMLARRRGWFRIVPNRQGAPTVVVVPEADLAGERGRTDRLDAP